MGITFWSLLFFAAVIGIAVWLLVRVSRASDKRRQDLRESVANRQAWDTSDNRRGVR